MKKVQLRAIFYTSSNWVTKALTSTMHLGKTTNERARKETLENEQLNALIEVNHTTV